MRAVAVASRDSSRFLHLLPSQASLQDLLQQIVERIDVNPTHAMRRKLILRQIERWPSKPTLDRPLSEVSAAICQVRGATSKDHDFADARPHLKRAGRVVTCVFR
jgi:hypothetical protein